MLAVVPGTFTVAERAGGASMLIFEVACIMAKNGGEAGIRTLGTLLEYGALAKRCFRPLSHLTGTGGTLIRGSRMVNRKAQKVMIAQHKPTSATLWEQSIFECLMAFFRNHYSRTLHFRIA